MTVKAPTATADSVRYHRVSDNFDRPADTTAYASGDLVADTTTAASVAPLEFPTAGARACYVPAFRLHKEGPTGDIVFRLYLYATSPTVSTAGDNGVFASNVNNAANLMAVYEGTVYGHKDGAVGDLVPISGVIKKEYVGDPITIYGLLEIRTAYTPVSAETVTVTMIQEFDS